jgi:uncharacterized protein YecE (DUF72 family)
MLTAEDGYVRFHGRNARNWWGSRRSQARGRRLRRASRCRILRPWRVERIATTTITAQPSSGNGSGKIAGLAEQARRTYLFFNNCHAGQAARNAKLMQELLRQQKLPA